MLDIKSQGTIIFMLDIKWYNGHKEEKTKCWMSKVFRRFILDIKWYVGQKDKTKYWVSYVFCRFMFDIKRYLGHKDKTKYWVSHVFCRFMLYIKSQSTIHSKDFVDSCLTYNGLSDIGIKRQNIECSLYFVDSCWT